VAVIGRHICYLCGSAASGNMSFRSWTPETQRVDNYEQRSHMGIVLSVILTLRISGGLLCRNCTLYACRPVFHFSVFKVDRMPIIKISFSQNDCHYLPNVRLEYEDRDCAGAPHHHVQPYHHTAHNLFAPHRLALTAITVAALVVTILLTVKKFWNRQISIRKKQHRGITPYYCRSLFTAKKVAILSGVILSIVVWNYLQSNGNVNAEDWVLGIFAGHGTGGFHIVSFMEMLLLTSTPIYLLAVFIEGAAANHSAFITIRLEKRKNILNGILICAALFISLYSVLLAFIPIVALTVAGLPLNPEVLSLIGLSVAIKFFDIMAQTLFITAVYCLTEQITVGFVVLVFTNLLCVAGGKLAQYLPFGISSLARVHLIQINTEGIPYSAAIVIPLAVSGLLLIWLYTMGYKRLPNNQGGN
jgi:hypothetical protein